jgi:hypothetical protein
MTIQLSGMLLFKIYVSLLVQALQGKVTKLNPKDTKSDEITFF